MARIQTGAIVTDIAGSLGGHTFSRTLGGIALKNKGIPSNAFSNARAKQQSILTQATYLWLALSNAQRSAWSQWSKFQTNQVGYFQRKHMTGQNAYIQLVVYCLMCGVTPPTDPVFTSYSLNFDEPTLLGMSAEPDIQLTMFITDLVNPPPFAVYTRISAPMRQSCNNPNSGLKTLVARSDSPQNVNVQQSFIDLFGVAPHYGNRIQYTSLFLDTTNFTLSNQFVRTENIQGAPV